MAGFFWPAFLAATLHPTLVHITYLPLYPKILFQEEGGSTSEEKGSVSPIPLRDLVWRQSYSGPNRWAEVIMIHNTAQNYDYIYIYICQESKGEFSSKDITRKIIKILLIVCPVFCVYKSAKPVFDFALSTCSERNGSYHNFRLGKGADPCDAVPVPRVRHQLRGLLPLLLQRIHGDSGRSILLFRSPCLF